MDSLVQDLRQTVRSLWRSPVFAAIAIATLALGIGANVSIYSVVDHVLFRPFPYMDTDRLVTMWEVGPGGNDHNEFSAFAFREVRSRAKTLDRVVAYAWATANITGGDRPERAQAFRVSPDFFEALGVKPMLGRGFREGEDVLGKNRVTVITYDLWVRRFGADSQVLGKSIIVNGTPREIVGVLGRDERYPTPAELYVPLAMTPELWENRQAHYLLATGRLARGATREQAAQELASISRSLAERYPDTNARWSSNVQPFVMDMTRQLQPALIALLVAVGFVLLITCANVANLMLARGATRQQEMFVCSALGASRWRLGRRVLLESAVLAVVGGALGVMLAVWGVDVLVSLVPAGYQQAAGGFSRVRIDRGVLAFATLLIGSTVLLFGGIPAWRASRSIQLDRQLRAGGRNVLGARHRARSALIAAQVGLAMVLLVGAGLTVRGFGNLTNRDLGVETDKAALVTVALSGTKWNNDAVANFWKEFETRARAIPGVNAVGLANVVPVCTCNQTTSFTIDGAPAVPQGDEPEVGLRVVSPGFHEALGVKTLRGRRFTDNDRAGTPPVILVNAALEKRYFPKGAIGQHVHTGNSPSYEIVGVVSDVRHGGPASDPQPELYYPLAQNLTTELTLAARVSHGDPASYLEPLRKLVTEIDPETPVFTSQTMSQRVMTTVGALRLSAWLLTTMALLALLLSVVGIHGVVSQQVAERTREIGIRMALGGNGRSVVLFVMRRGLVAVALGLSAGLVAAFALSATLRNQLTGVEFTDPLTYVGVGILLGGAAMFATYVPARRAAHVDPMNALRAD